jgi:hypothetical protein
MSRLRIQRALVGALAVGSLTVLGGCFFPGGGGGGGGGGGCISESEVTLGTPFTICLPNADSRVSVTFLPPLSADTVANIVCDAGASDLLVKTLAADNYSCGSFNTNDTATRTITAAENSVEFGVNPYINGGTPPGEATVTITAALP